MQIEDGTGRTRNIVELREAAMYVRISVLFRCILLLYKAREYHSELQEITCAVLNEVRMPL